MGNYINYINRKRVIYPSIIGSILVSILIFYKPLKRLFILYVERNLDELRRRHRPARLILIRHGHSEANQDYTLYSRLPDNRINLSEMGIQQAQETGKKLKSIIGDQEIKFFISPYKRTKQTFENIIKSLDKNQYIFEEEALLKEQEGGNIIDPENLEKYFKDRNQIGPFYYRFQTGESGGDVLDRATLFLSFLFREFDRLSANKKYYENVAIISHGIFINCFLMRLFRWTVEEFEAKATPSNCQIIVLDKDIHGRYHFNSASFLKDRDANENILTKDKK